MPDPVTMGLLVSAGVGLSSGVLNNLTNFGVASKNYNLQKKNYELQKAGMLYHAMAQQKSWAREDNAVQRRVADLKEAGINPLLAAGSAAASSSPIQVHPPQQAPQLNYHAQDMLGLEKASTLINMSHVAAQNDEIKARIEILKENAREAAANADIREWEALDDVASGGGLHLRRERLEADIAYMWDHAKSEGYRADMLRQEYLEMVDPNHMLHGPQRDRLRREITHIISQTDLNAVNYRKLARELAIITDLGFISVPTGELGVVAHLANMFKEAIKNSQYPSYLDYESTKPRRARSSAR